MSNAGKINLRHNTYALSLMKILTLVYNNKTIMDRLEDIKKGINKKILMQLCRLLSTL